MRKKNLLLLSIVFIASVMLTGINFYTIKTLSALRSFINAESTYSKAKKDASLYLCAYIQTEDTTYWRLYGQSVAIPRGDSIARVGLLHGGSDETITLGFVEGGVHPLDIPDMIWVFKNFRSFAFMKAAIRIWNDADPYLGRLEALSLEARRMAEPGTSAPGQKEIMLRKVIALTTERLGKSRDFSNVMTLASRAVNKYLLIANIICIIIILGSIVLCAQSALSGLSRYASRLNASNIELRQTNQELDTFVYSVSHDLRSPITSLKGLIMLMKMENPSDPMRHYVELMENVVEKQDLFIMEIIDFFKNKRSSLFYKDVDLHAVIDEVVANNEFTPLANGVVINRKIEVDKIYTDELRLKMILNNLVSNAIKYSDERKPERTLFICANALPECMCIEVEDNGVGIDEEYLSKIFDIFFVTPNNNRGTGLGLYILKQNVEKLRGRIEVHSVPGKGSRFVILLPHVAPGKIPTIGNRVELVAS